MHPIWVEMLQKPVGWLTIIGGIIIIALPFVVRAFIRKQMREEDKRDKGTGGWRRGYAGGHIPRRHFA